MVVTDDDIVAQLKVVLREVDLQTTSAKKVRKMLSQHFGEDLSSRKQFISGEIVRLLRSDAQQRSDGTNSAPSAPAETTTKPKRGSTSKPSRSESTDEKKSGELLSPTLSKFVGGATHMTRPQVVKRMWEYIREHNLQDPANRRIILCDDTLKELLQPGDQEVNMFNMNKMLAQHFPASSGAKRKEASATAKPAGASQAKNAPKKKVKNSSSPPTSSNGAKRSTPDAKPKVSAAKKRKKAEVDLSSVYSGPARQANRRGGLALAEDRQLQEALARSMVETDASSAHEAQPKRKPQKKTEKNVWVLDEGLADALGIQEDTRPNIVKSMWEYIRKHHLQNPDKRNEIINDEKFRTIFGVEKMTIFSMNKFLSKHVRQKSAEAAASAAAEESDEGSDAA